MRHLLCTLLAVALATPALRADEKKEKAPKSEGFEALKKDYDKAQKEFSEKQQALVKAFQKAETDEAKQEARKKLQELSRDNPGVKFFDRFVAFAEKHAKDPAAVDALVLALRDSGGPMDKTGKFEKVVSQLQKHVKSDSEKVRLAVRMLAGTDDEASQKFVKAVAEENPDKKTRARAYQALADARKSLAESVGRLKEDERFRQLYEQQRGKKAVEKLMALDADKLKKEAEEYGAIIKEKFADAVPDLSVGKAAPEVVMEDIGGKKAKLSDLKGKVVVLDIWATWCPPCRAMIPHERALVKRLKDKPFELVSISADEKKETLTKFIAENPMPWTHWWNGNEGGIIEDWNVEYFPTIYVLDHKGVIRYKDVRGEKMDEAVDKLLAEMGEKKDDKKEEKK
jgi:thiol-disulfide isomerase/thioredoxin